MTGQHDEAGVGRGACGDASAGIMTQRAIEHGITFDIAGERAMGVLHEAVGETRAIGVLLIVGGPQYRVGSHRQFVLLARRLAQAGYPVLRFDYRGIGDSVGEPRTFETIDEDVHAAADVLVARTGVARLVLWGLCDAASAAMMYAHRDARVAGLALANPWVHSPQGEARVRLKSYYLGRLANVDFWRKLGSGEIDWRDSLGSLRDYLRQAFGRRAASAGPRHFIARMAEGWSRFAGRTLLILSGDDLTADEFRELCATSTEWQRLEQRPSVSRVEMRAANHTFSSAEWRAAVEDATLDWLDATAGGGA